MRRRKGERRQDFLLRAHDAEGKRLFGKRWDGANIGWGSTGESIASKVYGSLPQILCTFLVKNGDAVTHQASRYVPLVKRLSTTHKS